MVLHVSAQSVPAVRAAAKRWKIVEVGVSLLDRQKFVAVVKPGLIARAIQQPELAILMPLRLLKQPLRHSPHRSDTSTGRDKHGVLMWLTKSEHAVRPMEVHDLSFLQVAQPVRQKTFFHAIQAQVERGQGTGSAGNRVSPSVNFSIGLWLLDGNELAGNEGKCFDALNRKLEMLRLFRQSNRASQTGAEQLSLRGLSNRSLGRRNYAIVGHVLLDAPEMISRQASATRKGGKLPPSQVIFDSYSTVTDFAKLRG